MATRKAARPKFIDMAFSQQTELTLAQELEALKVAVAYLTQLHGEATDDWKAAKTYIPDSFFTKPPKVHFARDYASQRWVVYAELPKN